MSLADDVARCVGLRDAIVTVRPLPMCQECARWQNVGNGGPRTPHIQPHAIVQIEGGGLVLHCSRRIAAPAEG